MRMLVYAKVNPSPSGLQGTHDNRIQGCPMRIWKKIATGFGVLLILVLLVGVVALSALRNISDVTASIIADLPPMSEQVLDLRRHLLRGIKDYSSYFLTSQKEAWETGKQHFQQGQDIVDTLDIRALNPERQATIDPLINSLREDIGRYMALATLVSHLDAESRTLTRSMLTRGNEATGLALKYMEVYIRALNSPVPLSPAELQNTIHRIQTAETLNSQLAETRATVSSTLAEQRFFPVEGMRSLLEKNQKIIHDLLATERSAAAKDLLQTLDKTLTEHASYSKENTLTRQRMQENARQMALLENTLYDNSRVLLQQVRGAFLDQLAQQRTLVSDASTMLMLFLAGTLLAGVVFALLLGSNLSQSIMTTLRFARSVSAGNINHRLPVNARDELGQINQAMNSMLDSLDNKIEEAHQKELEAIEARHQAERAQEDAENASRAKGDFLARMSHEIRTPMNAVIGLSHLCMQTNLDEQQRKYMNKILCSANELLGILNEILDFSKIEGGRLELDHIPFHLDVVMDNLDRIISQRAKAKGLDFVYHMARNIPAVLKGDPLRLTQVLINLAGNAVKFTDKGTVAISVSCAASSASSVSLHFRIKDTGIGMTPEQFQHIFQPFMQVDGSITRRFGGTGIGLSVSQRLVALMNGSIEAKSNPDGGCIFSFTIPLDVVTGAAPTPLRKIRDIRALIVDDSPLALQITAANMRALDINADCVESGLAAIDAVTLAERNGMPYHLVILDWCMPDMDGLETARRIREATAGGVPPALILHSDYDTQEVQRQARDTGIDAFLPKPATASAVSNAIMTALGDKMNGEDNTPGTDGSTQHVLAPAGPPRVLLVEDNEINQEIACELLKMARVDVDTANNGQEALEAVASTAYDLIFMDVQMPVMDGLEATRRIRAAGHTMPIIAMTAHAMRGDKDISLTAGMNDHLTKPLDPEALFASINYWLPTAMPPADLGAAAQKSVVSPQQTAPRPTRKLPEHIKGFNLFAGLAAVGKNEDLYADLLNKFAVRYATITEDISNSLINNDLEAAVRLAHTVKGIAANLGAESLAEAAGMLEKTITQDPGMTAPHLKTLVSRLADAVSAVRAALDGINTEGPASSAASMCSMMSPDEAESLGTRLHEAVLHMETDWNKASDMAQQVHKMLEGTDLAQQALELRYAVEDFDTQTALELSQALGNSLHSVIAAHSQTA